MLFTAWSFIFFVLLPSVIGCVICEKILKKRRIMMENIILVVMSFLFFMWGDTKHVKVLIIIILLNFLLGKIVPNKKWILLGGIIANLSVLAYYKYLHAILVALSSVKTLGVDPWKIVAPIGISFIVFHAISYLMDVYQGKAKASKQILNFALYLCFFPKLMQGPIVKWQEMKPEIEERRIRWEDFVSGCERFILGLGKKVLLANVLGEVVTTIFQLSDSGMDMGTAWLGAVCFTLQIYMDFSGYSDMAIGMGRMFGFHFKENFDFPYRSLSITEFWRRWHISLGAWFREYLYFPMGGSKRGNVYLHLLVVFLATGLWHGASLVYVGWGLSHGICMLVERYLMKNGIYDKIPKWIRWGYTMFVVNLGWVVFQTGSPKSFGQYAGYLFGVAHPKEPLAYSLPYFITRRTILIIGVVILGIIILGNEKIRKKMVDYNRESQIYGIMKYMVLTLLLILCFTAMVAGVYAPFLYFQF
ncbi:MAG: MBOAT family O-acyltransferase [Lachnospiraceae bacterium]